MFGSHELWHEGARRQLLLPLFVTLGVLFFGTVLTLAWTERIHQQARAQAKLETTDRAFREILSDEAAKLGAFAAAIQHDRAIESALFAHDRDRLLIAARLYQDTVFSPLGVTSISFYDGNRTVFLKVHKPEQWGERTERATFARALNSLTPAYGLEVTNQSALTLLYVAPWMDGGKLRGVIEIGKDIGELAPRLAREVGGQVFFFVPRSLLNRQAWEQRHEAIASFWDRFDDCVLVGSSEPELIDAAALWHTPSRSDAHPHARLLSAVIGKTSSGLVPLFDPEGKGIGEILFSESFAAESKEFWGAASVPLMLFATASVLLLWFFSVYLGTLDRSAAATLRDLEHEFQERRAMESTLAKSNDELRRLLSHSQELAYQSAAATLSRNEFIVSMSREIRTTMNAILGNTSLLLASDLATEQRNAAVVIRLSAASLLNLLNDILDMLNIEAGRLEFESIDLEIREIVEDVLDIAAAAAAEKKLDIAGTVDPDVPEVIRADPARIRQIALNLVNNAVQFTQRGEIHVRVKCEQRGEKRCLRVEVRDSGPGIPVEEQKRIFEPFTRAKGGFSGGAGLGLALSKQLAEAMGGAIGVESAEGKGSVFWFDVPLLVKVTCTTLREFEGSALFVLHDHEPTRRAIISTVSRWGVAATGAASAGAAFDVVRTTKAPLVLLVDARHQALAHLIPRAREKYTGPSLLIIGILERGDNDPPKALEAIGVRSFVHRPIRQTELRKVLTTLRGKVSAEFERPKLTAKKSLRVLVAEDNPACRELAEHLLKRLGHTTHSVATGREAVRALQFGDFDVVLMDVQMPEMNGCEATRLIRHGQAGVNNTAIPVIAMTASTMKEERQQCFAAGMSLFIPKPIALEDLAEVMTRIFAR